MTMMSMLTVMIITMMIMITLVITMMIEIVMVMMMNKITIARKTIMRIKMMIMLLIFDDY